MKCVVASGKAKEASKMAAQVVTKMLHEYSRQLFDFTHTEYDSIVEYDVLNLMAYYYSKMNAQQKAVIVNVLQEEFELFYMDDTLENLAMFADDEVYVPLSCKLMGRLGDSRVTMIIYETIFKYCTSMTKSHWNQSNLYSNYLVIFNAEEKREGVLVIVDRYYYHQLNKQDQAVYCAFYDGVMDHQDIIPIPVRGDFLQETFERIFEAMTKDNPLIYYLNQSACSIASDMFGHIAICPQYFFSKEKVREYNRKIEKVVNELAGQLQLLECSDYEKELRIHDWICQNIKYDYEGADKSKVSRVIASHNILGVFAYHKAQCEGIAKAVKVLLNAVDVKCIVVLGRAVKSGKCVPHAWNIVSIDGETYQLDVTWDMGASTKCKIAYTYFNMSDETIEVNHKADCKLPESV